jgi:outer membrane protein OmpA-like peptidoglycan-associated protein
MFRYSFSFPLISTFCLALFVFQPAPCFAQQSSSYAPPDTANQENPSCPHLQMFPALPMAIVASCQSGDSVGITLPLKPDASGLAQEKRVRGQYEFREYHIPQSDQLSAFANLMTLLPIAGFVVEYTIKPSTITARNGEFWMLINVADETYSVSVVRSPQQPWAPVKTAEEISQQIKAHNQVAIYEIEFSPADQAIQEQHSQILFEILKCLKQNPELSIVIESYKASNAGSPEDDLEITRERANAVMDWLVAHGIPRSRLQPRPFGRKNPLAEDDIPNEIRQNGSIVLARAAN